MITLNKTVIVVLAFLTVALSWKQISEPKLSVGIFAQNGVYAYFAAAFVPVIFGIFYSRMKAWVALTGSITAIAVHFSVYYILPWMVSGYGFSFGFFTRYLEGPVRNPAIACSSAVVISTLVVLILIIFTRNSAKKEINA